MRTIQFAIIAILSCLFVSCGKGMNEMESFYIGADLWPVSNEAISEDYLRQTLDGFGWHWIEGKTIKDGKVTGENYYQERDGAVTNDYYFHDGIVTSFIAPDFYPVLCYWNQTIRYDDEHNDLWIRETDQLRIVNIDSEHFTAVENVGVKSDGTKVFVLNTWRKMSNAELKHYEETYNRDFSELLDMLNN